MCRTDSDNNGEKLSPRRLSLAKRLFYAVLATLVLLLVVEASLRVCGVTFYPQAVTLSAEENRLIADPILQADGEVQWVVTPGTLSGTPLSVNSHGMRGPEVEIAKPADTLRILCLGDSCTFGARVEKPYPVLLEELIRSRIGKRVEVLNGGVPGHAAHQGVAMLGRFLKFSPDIVVVYYGWNDHWRRTEALSGPKLARPPVTDQILILRGLRLAIARWSTRNAMRDEEDDIDMSLTELRLPPLHYAGMLDEFAVVGEKQGIDVVFLTAPSALNLENIRWIIEERGWARADADVQAMHDYYNEITREISQEKGAVMVDLATIFERSDSGDLMHADGIHPSQAGHSLIAESIYQAILPTISAED